MTRGDKCPVFAFGTDGVFIFGCDSGQNPVPDGRIERHQCIGLAAGFVFASANDTRSLQIEVREIGVGFPALGV